MTARRANYINSSQPTGISSRACETNLVFSNPHSCDAHARPMKFYFRDTFRFFMTCISDGSLQAGRHGRGGLSIYPGGPDSLHRSWLKNFFRSGARTRAIVGTSLEP